MRIITYSIGLNRGTQPETRDQLTDTLRRIPQLGYDAVLHIGITDGDWLGVPERSLQVKASFDDVAFRKAYGLDPQSWIYLEAMRVAAALGQDCIGVHFNGSSFWTLCYATKTAEAIAAVEVGCEIKDNPLIEGNGDWYKQLGI